VTDANSEEKLPDTFKMKTKAQWKGVKKKRNGKFKKSLQKVDIGRRSTLYDDVSKQTVDKRRQDARHVVPPHKRLNYENPWDN
jgi:hypothetical protein